MEIELSAAKLFLSYIQGTASLDDVWEHPAYKIIRHHAALFGEGLSKNQVKNAVDGVNGSYYGIHDLKENLDEVNELMDVVEDKKEAWIPVLVEELDRVVPKETKDDIPIYPVFGYDIGMGSEQGVCINLNESIFFATPRQFLYLALHECIHTLYWRIHGPPSIHDIVSPEAMQTFLIPFCKRKAMLCTRLFD